MISNDQDDNPYSYSEYEDGKNVSSQSPLDEIQADGFHLELTPEVHFTTKALILPILCSILLFLIVLGGIPCFLMLLIAFLYDFLTNINQIEDWMRCLIPMLFTFIAVPIAYYAPWFLLSNFWVPRLVARFHPESFEQNEYICQFTTNPRRYQRKEHKQRAKLEDADDIGVLSLLDDRIAFHGDHTFFSLSYDEIRQAKKKLAFWNTLGLGGYYIRIYSNLFEEHGYKYVQIGERQSKTIIETYRLGRKIHADILEKMRHKSVSDF